MEKDRELRCRVRESRREIREVGAGLPPPVNQAGESQSGPPERRGAGGVLTYAVCGEGRQAACQGVQGWGAVGRGVGGRPRLVHGEGLAVPPVGVGVGGDRGGHREARGLRSGTEPT